MGFFDFLGFGNNSSAIDEYIAKGAVLIDVRSVGEFRGGSIKGAKNIPLDTLSGKVAEIKKLNKPVIVFCASGMRSSQATSLLKNNGIDVINGGGYMSLAQKF